MKIEVLDKDHFTIYYTLILDDILEYELEDLKTFIKILVLRLRKKYQLNDVEGYYHLDVYIQKIMILEFERIDDYEDEIDLSIKIHLNTPILLKFDDYFLISGQKKEYQGKYYVPIEEVDFSKYIEFVEFVYDEEAQKVLTYGKKV